MINECVMTNKNMLIELSEAFGPSGFEEEVKTIIVNKFDKLKSYKKTEDGLGSVIFSKETDKDKPTLTLVSHMDEIGYLVKYIDNEGFLKVQNLGGWLTQSMINRRWVIRTKDKDIIGVSGMKTIHVMDAKERTSFYKANNELFIECKAFSARISSEFIQYKISPSASPKPFLIALNAVVAAASAVTGSIIVFSTFRGVYNYYRTFKKNVKFLTLISRI